MARFQRKTHRAKRVLDAVAHRYPGAWATFDRFRRERGASPDFDWPAWCYMPIAGGYAVVSGGGDRRVPIAHADHPAIVTALGAWRMTQGIYRFDPALLPALLETPLEGDIPVEHLQRLPEWCVYVDLAAADIAPGLHGAWMHLEHDVNTGMPEFRVVLDCARDPRQPFAADGVHALALPLAGSIEDSLRALERSARHQAERVGMPWSAETAEGLQRGRGIFEPLLSLALYLCADADITRRGKPEMPRNPAPVRSGRQWVLHPASGPVEWDVGVRIGAALRAAYQREQTGQPAAPTGRHVRPHVRRAHWHTIVSGPRKREDGAEIPATERRRELRWMPPIPVAIEDYDALPATVRPVRGA